MPRLACDTHAHVFGPLDTYPCIAERNYTPAIVGGRDYRAMHDRLGIARGVLVQPSVYGTDNSCILDALRRQPDRLRGIAVVDPEIGDRELKALDRDGIRGLRFNLLYRGGTSLAAMEVLARRIAPLGWHVDLLIDGEILPEIASRLAALPVPVVFDHMAQMPSAHGPETPALHALYRLLESGRSRVKLSGANRVSTELSGFRDTLVLGARLASLAPDFCFWGSDWPHVAVAERIDTGVLLNLFAEWVPAAETRQRILVDNPAAFFGFPPKISTQG
jgi:predicted TIM-barrel fold metal-dependent hydrolase